MKVLSWWPSTEHYAPTQRKCEVNNGSKNHRRKKQCCIHVLWNLIRKWKHREAFRWKMTAFNIFTYLHIYCYVIKLVSTKLSTTNKMFFFPCPQSLNISVELGLGWYTDQLSSWSIKIILSFLTGITCQCISHDYIYAVYSHDGTCTIAE